MSATARPWILMGSNNGTPHIMHNNAGHKDGPTVDDQDSLVCHMPAEIQLKYNSWANGKLIVHRVNAHDGLVDALKDMLALLGEIACGDEAALSGIERILRARVSLESAEEKK